MKSNRNSQDSYPYAGLKCYSKENLKIRRGRFWCIIALKSDIWWQQLKIIMFHCTSKYFYQIVIVWRVRGKTIRSVLCNIVFNNCAQCDAHTYEQKYIYIYITVLFIGFCLTGPISLCLDSFWICIILCLTVYCMRV